MEKDVMCSVLITSHNSANFIEYTLHSICWQTFSDIEILIVDNNSTDNTVEIIEKYPDKRVPITLYKSPENLGAFGWLNFLLEKTKAKYIAIIDHDDIRHPHKLAEQLSFLESNPSYVWCGCTFLDVREGKNFCKYELFTIPNVVMHSSLVFRNRGYRYDATLRYADREFMVHVLAKDGPLHHMDPIWILRRIRRTWTNISVQFASFDFAHDSKDKDGVARYERIYNILRFRYVGMYIFILRLCMPWKLISLTKFTSKPLWAPYKDFVLKAFA